MTLVHDRFVAPARLRPELWRLLLGIFLIVITTLLGTLLVFGAGWLFRVDRSSELVDWLASVATPDHPLATLLVLFSFLGLFAGPLLAAKWLHKRSVKSLFGPAAKTMRDFIFASFTVGALMTVSAVLWTVSYDPAPNLPLNDWLTLLPVALLGLLIQTGAEELVFRGYLQQQLAARFRSAWVWLFIPSVLFGLVHFNSALAAETAWLIVGAATAFGIAAADLTAKTGSIGAAWGFHFANNLFAIAFLSTQGTITGLSLFLTPYSVEQSGQIDMLILFDFGFLVLAWWLVRRVVAR